MSKKLFELIEKYEAAKQSIREIRIELDAELNNKGIGFKAQNSENGIVLEIVRPTGTFIEFKEIDYIRTRKKGEKSGSLSLKKAEEMGFTVPKE